MTAIPPPRPPLTIPVPTGRWLRRVDSRDDMEKYPVLAYGLDDAVLVIQSDGTHTVASKFAEFPSSNWVLWGEVEC